MEPRYKLYGDIHSMNITYYDFEGQDWYVDDTPLTPAEEKELGIICAIKYSNQLTTSPIKTRGVYEPLSQNKYYVKMVNNVLYDPADERYNVHSTPPKSQNAHITTSKKAETPKVAPAKRQQSEGVVGCKTEKPTEAMVVPAGHDYKSVTATVFDHYVNFLKNKHKRYYTAATREM